MIKEGTEMVNKTINRQKEYILSKTGLKRLQRKLGELRLQRKEQVQALATLREQQSTDVSLEDASFIYSMRVIQFIDSDIERTEEILANAKTLRPQPKRKEEVTLGSKVTLKGEGKSFEYTIVQSLEADPLSGKISDESPLGRQLLGRRLWDSITFHHSSRRKPMDLQLVGIS
jgi:transcription elongation factor GreA